MVKGVGGIFGNGDAKTGRRTQTKSTGKKQKKSEKEKSERKEIMSRDEGKNEASRQRPSRCDFQCRKRRRKRGGNQRYHFHC